MARLLDLPLELLLLIGDYLVHEDAYDHSTLDGFLRPQSWLYSLVCTNKWLHCIFQDKLYNFNVKYGGQSALAFGVFHGNDTIVQKTLSIDKSNILSPISGWVTKLDTHVPICWAAQGGQIGMIRFLLDSGATLEPDCWVEKRNDPRRACEGGLHMQAAKNGHRDTMKELVKMGLAVNSQKENRKYRWEWSEGKKIVSPLRAALENDQRHCIEFILDTDRYKGINGQIYSHRILMTVPLTVNPSTPTAEHDGIESALFMLQRSGFTDKKNIGKCPIHPTCSPFKNLSKLKQTLEKPGNFELYGEMLLYLAAIAGDVRILDEMIQMGVPLETRFRAGNTPLCIAALEGGPVITKRLLELGADPNLKNGQDQSPLFLATLSQSTAVVKELLEHGADVNAPSTRYGIVQTPLWRAVADRGRPELGKRSKATGIRNKQAGQVDIREMVPMLLRNGADPRFCDPTYGISTLWLAVQARYLSLKPRAKTSESEAHDIIRELIDCGADINEAGRGVSLLCCAIPKLQHKSIKLLLDHGVDPNDYGKGFDGSKPYHRGQPLSPLAKALHHRKYDTAELLLDHGAELTSSYWKKETCLANAARSGSCSLIKKMLDKGVDVDESFGGKTALQIAVWKENAEMTELLRSRGADVKTIAAGTCLPTKSICAEIPD